MLGNMRARSHIGQASCEFAAGGSLRGTPRTHQPATRPAPLFCGNPMRFCSQEQVLLFLSLLSLSSILAHGDPAPFATFVPLDRLVAFRVDFVPSIHEYVIRLDATGTAFDHRAVTPLAGTDFDALREIAASRFDCGHILFTLPTAVATGKNSPGLMREDDGEEDVPTWRLQGMVLMAVLTGV